MSQGNEGQRAVMDHATIKRLAKEFGCRATDLIVLAPQNDPFYAGSPAQRRDAEWFAQLWEEAEYGNGNRVHLRRIHYRLVSFGTIIKPDGTVYQNTERDWEYLGNASKCARVLGIVDAWSFEDRRNPDPIINTHDLDAHERVWNPQISSPLYDWDFPTIDATFGESSCLGMPVPTVHGYDYFEHRQPYHIEIWCEKSTMNDILEPMARQYKCNVQTSLGFQSLSSALDLIARGEAAEKAVRVLYLSDYDPAGTLMPQATARQLEFWTSKYAPNLNIALKAIVLTREQVEAHDLPRIPIKETDRRKKGFEEREGKGAVELDALEALHPGELRRIIVSEIERLRDPRLDRKYWIAGEEAEQAVNSEWEQATAHLHEEIQSLEKDFGGIRERFERKIEALRGEYREESRPIRDRFENLRQAIRNEAENFDPFLPDLPEPEVEGDDPEEWLYHSARSYGDQLVFYKRAQEL